MRGHSGSAAILTRAVGEWADPAVPRRGRPRVAETALSRWLDAGDRDRDEVAAELGISRSHLDRLCRGARRPSLKTAHAIENLTGGVVPAKTWLDIDAHSGDE
jgi:transcriptional regulator with XRE-family HTH domain